MLLHLNCTPAPKCWGDNCSRGSDSKRCLCATCLSMEHNKHYEEWSGLIWKTESLLNNVFPCWIYNTLNTTEQVCSKAPVQCPVSCARCPLPPIFGSASATAAVHRQQSNRPLYRELSDDDSLFFANSVLIQDKLTSVKWRFYTILGHQEKSEN